MRINYNVSSIIAKNAMNNNDKRVTASTKRLSSGYKINSAADNAAGLAIARRMNAQIKSLQEANQSANDGLSALNTADGAMAEIHDILQRMNELAIQSANGTNADSDREMIQKEIDQLKQGIEGLARDTSFNEQKLLDGSMADMAIATSPNGGSMHIQMENSTLEALGIADLDVTSKDFSLDAIDRAMDMVTQRRASLGGATNALEYTRNYNNSASINQLSARSRLEDLDFPKAIAKKKQDEVLGQYRVAMLRRQMDQKRKSMTALF